MKELKKEFKEMMARLAAMEGGAAVEGLAGTLATTDRSTALRVNRRKGGTVAAAGRRVEWSEGRGFLIDGERPPFTFDPAFHQGRYYVQDPSSMAVGEVVARLTADGRPVVYVDACAAPGGKTTAAVDALPAGSLVIANEWDRRRAEVLKENVMKWGSGNVAVSRGDTSAFSRLGPMADIVAVDAPCSGEGMMRKDDDAVAQWSEGLVARCAALQREIVANLWAALKPGGYLIYSTCTFNRRENEENVEWMVAELGAEVLPTGLERYEGVAGAIGGGGVQAARFIPGRVDGEGLFMALLRKPTGPETTADTPSSPRAAGRGKSRGKAGGGKDDSFLRQAAGWVSADVELAMEGDTVVAFPAGRREELARIGRQLDLIYAGTEVATVRGRDLIPSQALALSDILAADAFARVEVDYAAAIACLRGESMTLPEGSPRGVVLLTYGGCPLSFVKNLGNRANNLYPKGWAIKSTHRPDLPPRILLD